MGNGECKFGERVYWTLNNENRKFKCEEKPLDSGFCIFHDEYFLDSTNPSYEQNKEKILNEFHKKWRGFTEKNQDYVFIGYILPGIAFKNHDILNDVFFNYSVFKDYVEFKNIHFMGKCLFRYVLFEIGCSFHHCTFDFCSFDNAIFLTNTRVCEEDGNTVIWKGHQASFYGSKFIGPTSFRSTNKEPPRSSSINSLTEDTRFSTCIFSNKVDFGYSKFVKMDFEGAQFLGEVSLFNTTFNSGKFNETVFECELHINASTCEDLSFSNSKLNELFLGSSSMKICAFTNCEFLKRVDYFRNKFEQMKFIQCSFNKKCDFKETVFGKCDFSFSEFLDSVYFTNPSFMYPSLLNYVKFEKAEQAIFQEADLSNVSFANTDITRINFGDNTRFGGKDGNTIIEEIRLTENKHNQTNDGTQTNLKSVLSIYRNLRENYEFRLRYDEAGSFFVKEMELKRKYKEVLIDNSFKIIKKNWLNRNLFSLLRMYKLVANYGESYKRPVIVGVILSLFTMLLWLTQSNPYGNPSFTLIINEDFLSSTSSSFIGFEQISNITHWISAADRTDVRYFHFHSR